MGDEGRWHPNGTCILETNMLFQKAILKPMTKSRFAHTQI
jgi:hypothetical protein